MSVEVKQIILKNLEKKLGSILTVDNTNEVLKIVAEEIEYYNIE